jgi:hypothetical protein
MAIMFTKRLRRQAWSAKWLWERRFLFMVQQTPFFALRVMRLLTERLRAMNEWAKDLT